MMRYFTGLLLLLVLSGCTIASPPPVSTRTKTSVPAADVTFVTPSATVDRTVPLTLKANNGTFDEVLVARSDDDTATVSGLMNEDKKSWTTNTELFPATEYRYFLRAHNSENKEFTKMGSFVMSDADESAKIRARTNIGDNFTVGVASPIIISFDGHVDDGYRPMVQSRMNVSTSQSIEGSWAWLPDFGGPSRLHYRTRDYWPANTPVHVDANLSGIPYGNGKYGKDNITLDFTIGRSQIVTSDVDTHRMSVVRDGAEIANYPASLGAPGRESYSGVHIVMGKRSHMVMTSTNYGYSTPVDWAVQISNNGEFIHAAPWSISDQGVRNVSHGCINISTSRAKEYFDGALYGDPVIITGSPLTLDSSQGDVWDWTVDYDTWKKMSAI